MDVFERKRIKKIIVLVTLGLLVHLLILKAAFDIYFSSPIDHGMSPIKSTNNPPAKRLVLIVADGLRAEALYEDSDIAPNLRNIRENRGSWGVTYTRVPTESRPGHVALLGGIYEDPSAILKGWKANPVDFDSVINQSTNAWCWGGPSIINMFNNDNLPHIRLHSYDPKMEDFGTNNTLLLDMWVFDRVKEFIEQQKNCSECIEFRQSGNLFFLHLLGIDTAGHAHKPHSFEYKNNINYVDNIVPMIEELFESAFPDKSTAYVFTADHGMTNWGSHGAGSDHETNIPLIAWGAGIKVDKVRKDTNQIDVATLMSALIGINIPINSLGQLPHAYVDTPVVNLYEMMLANVRQLMETFNVKRYRIQSNTIHFVPFQGITSEVLDEKMAGLNSLTKQLDPSDFIKEAEDFMNLLIEGADYYHNYYQLPLLISVTVGFCAWIIYLSTVHIEPGRIWRASRGFTLSIKLIFCAIYLTALYILKVQSLPLVYYIYFLFPIVMIQILVLRYQYLLQAIRGIKSYGIANFVSNVMLYGGGLMLLVQSFHNREVLSVVTFLMSLSVWSAESSGIEDTVSRRLTWMLFCTLTGMFSLLPVMQTSFNYPYFLSGYLIWIVLYDNIIEILIRNHYYSLSSIRVIKLQHFMFKMTLSYVVCIDLGFIRPDSNLKYVAWIWAFYPMVMIFRTSTHIFIRLISIFLGFSTFYSMMSSSFELLFMVNYTFVLLGWIAVEGQIIYNETTLFRTMFALQIQNSVRQSVDDYRRAFIFITLIFTGFFGTGNIASLNSFDPMWVRCFLTVFSPFKMTALIILKISIPFICASCTMRAVNILRKTDTLRMFSIILMYSDLMLLELLYYITNIGSWLEIGMSLSHFIIMEAFVVIVILLYGIAHLLTNVQFRIPFWIIFDLFFGKKLIIFGFCGLVSAITIWYTLSYAY